MLSYELLSSCAQCRIYHIVGGWDGPRSLRILMRHTFHALSTTRLTHTTHRSPWASSTCRLLADSPLDRTTQKTYMANYGFAPQPLEARHASRSRSQNVPTATYVPKITDRFRAAALSDLTKLMSTGKFYFRDF